MRRLLEIPALVLTPAMCALPSLEKKVPAQKIALAPSLVAGLDSQFVVTCTRYGARELEFDLYHPAARGFVAVTISCRLSGEAKFPAAIHDTSAASYGIDADVIGVTGQSADGRLVPVNANELSYVD